MLDYGEFVPEALLTSGDSNFRKLGQKMDLFELNYDIDVIGDALYVGMIGAMMDGTHAITETSSYLK